MIPEELYKLGDMLGLEHRDIQNFIIDPSGNTELPFSPADSYKFGLYGTLSINDF